MTYGVNAPEFAAGLSARCFFWEVETERHLIVCRETLDTVSSSAK